MKKFLLQLMGHVSRFCSVIFTEKHKISLVNNGVGGKSGILTFQDGSVSGYADYNFKMEIISIKDALGDFDFVPDILKMVCEVCEFEILLNNDLTMFNDIIFEYCPKMVNKDYKSLIGKLEEQWFKINTFNCNS